MRCLSILASSFLFLWLGFGGADAALGPARLPQPEASLTQAQYYPGWRHHPGWRWRYAHAQTYAYLGGRWHHSPGWRWRHPGWRWGH